VTRVATENPNCVDSMLGMDTCADNYVKVRQTPGGWERIFLVFLPGCPRGNRVVGPLLLTRVEFDTLDADRTAMGKFLARPPCPSRCIACKNTTLPTAEGPSGRAPNVTPSGECSPAGRVAQQNLRPSYQLGGSRHPTGVCKVHTVHTPILALRSPFKQGCTASSLGS
jgi:hypothetical protein